MTARRNRHLHRPVTHGFERAETDEFLAWANAPVPAKPVKESRNDRA